MRFNNILKIGAVANVCFAFVTAIGFILHNITLESFYLAIQGIAFAITFVLSISLSVAAGFSIKIPLIGFMAAAICWMPIFNTIATAWICFRRNEYSAGEWQNSKAPQGSQFITLCASKLTKEPGWETWGVSGSLGSPRFNLSAEKAHRDRMEFRMRRSGKDQPIHQILIGAEYVTINGLVIPTRSITAFEAVPWGDHGASVAIHAAADDIDLFPGNGISKSDVERFVRRLNKTLEKYKNERPETPKEAPNRPHDAIG